jgi:hypothetical protein
MQTESPEIILIKPRPRLTGVFYWIVLLVAVDAGFELYRVIQYCINWQFMLTLIKPFQFWLMGNISFIVFVASLPVLMGLFSRSDWAPVWCLRFLLATSLIGIVRTIAFSAAPLDSTSWVSLGVQAFMTIILTVFLFTGDPRRVFYANIE